MQRRPEIIAALVNGMIVLLIPPALSGAAAIATIAGLGVPDNSVVVHPPGWSPILPMTHAFRQYAAVLLPFAGVAFWRTWVHARRWRTTRAGSWQGVVEAGACGWLTYLVALLPALISQPILAVQYLIVVGSIALAIGLALGLVLRIAAIGVLNITART